ncbi:hypothetical protein MMYC01_208036 [Madurella mycetomatis]|uniref:DUF7582 domain-containing protein n=1 Tax=Madurella mycetomatis TaxID=100816 RepID=A0A175VV13_9PEZI|nr:hypothetical protein MMYC01_208036 [Madurella mycetomatis]
MASAPCLKRRISSPLEAGPSVADGHLLPSKVSEALEYASKKLGKKAAHITLLVVRQEYQLPALPIFSPTSSSASPPISATSRIDALKQLIRPSNSGEGQIRERILHLDHYRNGTESPAFSEASTPSTASSISTADSTFSSRQWPGSPAASGSVPITPATPFSVMSSVSEADRASTASGARQFGIKLVYAYPLSPREEKVLSQALDKAAKKFKLDPVWLPQPVSPSTLGLPVDLVWKSTTQNEALFSSDHLTLLSLDHLYTFRAALHAYSRSQALSGLEDAVDELRRLFLANCRHALRKSTLLTAYRWLDPVSDAALADVCRMYERAYGGIERENGVENDVDPVPAWPLANGSSLGSGTPAKRMGMAIPDSRQQQYQEPQQPRSETPIHDSGWADKEILLSTTEFNLDEQEGSDDFAAIEAWYRHVSMSAINPLRCHPAAVTTVVLPPSPSPTPPPPPPKSPARLRRQQPAETRQTTPRLRAPPPGRTIGLKLQTTFDKAATTTTTNARQTQQQPTQIPEEEEEDLTARPNSAIKTQSFANLQWSTDSHNSTSIDERLLFPDGGGDGGGQRFDAEEERKEERIGPMTPHGYDDISPITRGEWGFLMGGSGGLIGRVAKVEMC